jgi:hypothetical protein
VIRASLLLECLAAGVIAITAPAKFSAYLSPAGLLQRFQQGEGFQRYVNSRTAFIAPMGLLVLITSVAFAAATVVFLAGTRVWLGLPALLLAPFILIGSMAVQLYVLFSWLEGRALALALGHRVAKRGPAAAWIAKNLRAEMGAAPRVPWLFAAVLLLGPLAMLMAVSAKAAIALVLLHVFAPILYARFDR